MKNLIKLSFYILIMIILVNNKIYAVCKTASITATTPSNSFIDNGNGTISHKKTGLMWKQCSEGLSTTVTSCDTGVVITNAWFQALQLSVASNFAGYNDWRLPNIKELLSIVERQCSNPSINEIIFPHTVNNFYWTSSPHGRAIWQISFNTGEFNYFSYLNSGNKIRLVRGGL